MKRFLLIIFASLISIAVLATKPHTVDLKVDVNNSTVYWKGSKVIIEDYHDGNINLISGYLVVDHGTLVGGEFVIDMNTITCTDIESEKKRKYLEDHLKDEDFFDVGKYPQSILRITSATRLEGSNYTIKADLTIKGITQPIEFISTVNIRRNQFEATSELKIDRTRWGVEYKSGSIFKKLGDKAILDEIEFKIRLVSFGRK